MHQESGSKKLLTVKKHCLFLNENATRFKTYRSSSGKNVTNVKGEESYINTFGWKFHGKYLYGESRMKSKDNIKKNLNSLRIVPDGKQNTEEVDTFSKFCYPTV
jgi:hypothetical protein